MHPCAAEEGDTPRPPPCAPSPLCKPVVIGGTCLRLPHPPGLRKGCVTIRTYMTDFYLFNSCTDTGVIVTHALSFYRPMAPLVLLTHAQFAVMTQSCALLRTVTQSCALLYITAHCDLLLQ